jgi:short-subunit dehydrogenase
MNEAVVITGANAGIGLALTQTYLKKGLKVVALDLSSENLDSLENSNLFIFKADVTKSSAFDEVKTLGEIKNLSYKVWINNAGITQVGEFQEVGLDKFYQVMDVNLRGVVNGTFAAMGLMKEGSIVNMGSLASELATPLMSSYCASKHAVAGFHKSIALEQKVKGSRLHFLLVKPGFVSTKIIETNNNLKLPRPLKKIVGSTDEVAAEIQRGIELRKSEIYPTINGKMIKAFDRVPFFSETTSKKMAESYFKKLSSSDKEN